LCVVFETKPRSTKPRHYGSRVIEAADGKPSRDGFGLLNKAHKDGDVVNLIRKAVNYCWPVISYGRHYSGARIGERTSKQGLQQRSCYWTPSIAPSRDDD